MPKYLTTNLRFSGESYRELRLQTGRKGATLPFVVREAVAEYLGRTERGAVRRFGDDPADRMIGAIDSSAGDESVNHDHYLYGWPKDGSERDFRDCGFEMVPQEPAASRA